MKRTGVLILAIAAGTMVTSGQTLQPPTDWKWRTDAPAKLELGRDLPPGSWQFVSMPPGWHITTGPGAILYPAAGTLGANFRLEAEIFLFPGESQEEYGLFVGGAQIEPASGSPSYLAFVARRDGQAAILRRTPAGFTPVMEWKANDAVVPHSGTGTVKNILRVEATATDIIFSANGKEIAKIPRAGVNTAGAFGFRVGKDVNLHISTLDVTHRLAPLPVKK